MPEKKLARTFLVTTGQGPGPPSDAYVFVSERGGPMSPIGFHRLIQRLGETTKMPFRIHPHMLRHACGYKLANDGHDTRCNSSRTNTK